MEFPCTQQLPDDFDEAIDEVDEDEKQKKQIGILQVEAIATSEVDSLVYPVYEGDNVIGRHVNCDIAIPQGAALSKKHACIEAEGSAVFLYDYGSSNKTRLGSAKLKPEVRYALSYGDRICFANVKCTFKQSTPLHDQSSLVLAADTPNSSVNKPRCEPEDKVILESQPVDEMSKLPDEDSKVNESVLDVKENEDSQIVAIRRPGLKLKKLMVVSDSDSTDIEDNIDNDKMLKNETPDQEDHYDSETDVEEALDVTELETKITRPNGTEQQEVAPAKAAPCSATVKPATTESKLPTATEPNVVPETDDELDEDSFGAFETQAFGTRAKITLAADSPSVSAAPGDTMIDSFCDVETQAFAALRPDARSVSARTKSPEGKTDKLPKSLSSSDDDDDDYSLLSTMQTQSFASKQTASNTAATAGLCATDLGQSSYATAQDQDNDDKESGDLFESPQSSCTDDKPAISFPDPPPGQTTRDDAVTNVSNNQVATVGTDVGHSGSDVHSLGSSSIENPLDSSQDPQRSPTTQEFTLTGSTAPSGSPTLPRTQALHQTESQPDHQAACDDKPEITVPLVRACEVTSECDTSRSSAKRNDSIDSPPDEGGVVAGPHVMDAGNDQSKEELVAKELPVLCKPTVADTVEKTENLGDATERRPSDSGSQENQDFPVTVLNGKQDVAATEGRTSNSFTHEASVAVVDEMAPNRTLCRSDVENNVTVSESEAIQVDTLGVITADALSSTKSNVVSDGNEHTEITRRQSPENSCTARDSAGFEAGDTSATNKVCSASPAVDGLSERDQLLADEGKSHCVTAERNDAVISEFSLNENELNGKNDSDLKDSVKTEKHGASLAETTADENEEVADEKLASSAVLSENVSNVTETDEPERSCKDPKSQSATDDCREVVEPTVVAADEQFESNDGVASEKQVDDDDRNSSGTTPVAPRLVDLNKQQDASKQDAELVGGGAMEALHTVATQIHDCPPSEESEQIVREQHLVSTGQDEDNLATQCYSVENDVSGSASAIPVVTATSVSRDDDAEKRCHEPGDGSDEIDAAKRTQDLVCAWDDVATQVYDAEPIANEAEDVDDPLKCDDAGAIPSSRYSDTTVTSNRFGDPNGEAKKSVRAAKKTAVLSVAPTAGSATAVRQSGRKRKANKRYSDVDEVSEAQKKNRESRRTKSVNKSQIPGDSTELDSNRPTRRTTRKRPVETGAVPPSRVTPNKSKKSSACPLPGNQTEKHSEAAEAPTAKSRKQSRDRTAGNKSISEPSAKKVKSDEDDAPSDFASPAVATLRPRRSKPKVMFTGVVDQVGESIIRELGGQVTSDVHECTHLVTDKMRRTVKFLCALVRGIHIMSTTWLPESKKLGRFLPEEDFLLRDSSAKSPPMTDSPLLEAQYDFKLSASLQSARSSPGTLFSGLRIHVTKSVLPPPDQMYVILECGGATTFKSLARTLRGGDVDNVVVVAAQADKGSCATAIKRGVTVVSAEFVLTGILRQKLQPDLFRLFSSPEVESSPTATPAKPRVSMETRSGRANRSSNKRLTRASAGKRKTRSES